MECYISTSDLDDVPNPITMDMDDCEAEISLDKGIGIATGMEMDVEKRPYVPDLYCNEYLSDEDDALCVFKNEMYHTIQKCSSRYGIYNLKTIPATSTWDNVRFLLYNEPIHKQMVCGKCYRQVAEKESARSKNKTKNKTKN